MKMCCGRFGDDLARMTTERVIALAVPLDSERRQLLADIRSAADRARQAGSKQ
jgi:hypothetical protein